MKEENYLIEKFGKENPFRVPEGYFDRLSDQVMARIEASPAVVLPMRDDKKEKKAKTVWLRPVLYAAASVCALFVSVMAYMAFDGKSESVPLETVAVATMTDDSFDEAADYVMIDNQDIYACLSSDY